MKKKGLKRLAVSLIGAASIAAGSLAVPAVPAQAATNSQYAEALKFAFYFWDANQCGADAADNGFTWRSGCHTYDEQCSFSNCVNLNGEAKSLIKAQNGGHDYVDLSGGYHDCGDHIKYQTTMGFGGSSIGLSYYMHPEVFKNAGVENHAKYIMKEMSEYFIRCTVLNNSGEVAAFCYLVGDESDHNYWGSPEKQPGPRKSYWADASHPSSNAAGEMSATLASASMMLKNDDPTFAKKCLKYAKALQAFAQAHPGNTGTGCGGMYSSSSEWDDICWAKAWCDLAEKGDFTPVEYRNGGYQTPAGIQYDGWWNSWDKVWGGYAMLAVAAGHDEYLKVVEENANKCSQTAGSGQYIMVGGSWGSSRYNCSWQAYNYLLHQKKGDTSRLNAAKNQMDYLLGNNPANKSYVIGVGNQWAKQVHHRAANPDVHNGNPNSKYVLYGCMTGGPMDEGGTYQDQWDSYQCTEPGTDYEGCFVTAIVNLCASLKYYDTSLADDIIKSSSEITDPYGGGSGAKPTPTKKVTPTPTKKVTPTPTKKATPVPTKRPTPTPKVGKKVRYSRLDLDGRVSWSDLIATK